MATRITAPAFRAGLRASRNIHFDGHCLRADGALRFQQELPVPGERIYGQAERGRSPSFDRRRLVSLLTAHACLFASRTQDAVSGCKDALCAALRNLGA